MAGNGVELVGEQVGEPRTAMQLWRVERPARFRRTQTGIFPDGWMSSAGHVLAVRARDGVSRGFSKVVVSRQGACGGHPAADVTVRVGPVAVVRQAAGLRAGRPIERRKLEPCGAEFRS